MATGTGPCRSAPADQSHQNPHELSEDDLRVVFKALHSVAEKYKFLGVEMNVKMNEIKKIQSQCSDPGECLLEVLSVRLRQIPPLTWRDIDTALRSDTVGEPLLADRIRRKYRHLYSPNPSFEASFDQEQGRKMSKITKNKKKAKYAKKYMQQDSDKEVSESERYRESPEKLNVDEKVVKMTQQKAKKSTYTKRHSKPGKQYIEKESKHKGETQRKKKATKYDKESQVVCSSKHRHKVKHSEQRAQKEVQIESESESFASNSEEETVNTDDFETAEESYSSEQEKDSAEEVSETERYQKPSEQPRDDEYPHSHRETPVRKTKGKRGKSSAIEKTKFESQSKPEGKAKRKKKSIDQSVSNKASQHEMAGDAHGKHEKAVQECKQKKSEKHSKKGVQKAPRENESESSEMTREEGRSSSYHRGKSRKPKSAKDTNQLKQSHGKKLDYQTTAKKDVAKKGKGNVPVAGEQSSDEEVREKSAPKSHRKKEEQTKSESEDESSSASTSDDRSKLHVHESTRMREHHKVYPNTDGNEIEKERAVRIKKKTEVTKQKGSHSSDTDMRKQSKEGKRSTKVNQTTKKTSKEMYLKADTSLRKERKEQAEKERISSVIEQDTPSSDSTQEDSKDEESDSDDSSEDEEDRDSEQKSSNEEEETEPDDESSPDTSEEEVKRKPAVLDTNKRTKETGERKGKRLKIAADVQDLPGDEDQSDPGGRDQEEHDIQPKKRSRRRHRESSMSPTTRGSSSPSSSQGDGQQQVFKEQNQKHDTGSKRQRRKKKRRKNEKNVPSCSKSDDSSPECDMNKNLSKEEGKKLRNVFKRYFGQLCCEIPDPVETAAQLQKKGLISHSMMKDMIMSPESQQAKKITLLSALDKKIKSHPDCIFAFIESLFENTALQKVGVEILTEAGKLFINL